MRRSCASCGSPVDENDRYCVFCGAEIHKERVPAAAPPFVEIEANRHHRVSSLCQLRFRVTSSSREAQRATMRVVLAGRHKYVEQDEREIEHSLMLDDWSDRSVFSFLFFPLGGHEVPLDTLRVAISPTGQPEQSRLYTLPDRALFVQIGPAAPAAGPSVRIEGGINLSVSDIRDLYGTDFLKTVNLLEIHADQQSGARDVESVWVPIRLRPVGTEIRSPCQLPGCDACWAADWFFACPGCGRSMCRRHRDYERPDRCQLCAESLRADAFHEQAQHLPDPTPGNEIMAAELQLTPRSPSFNGRVWTDRNPGALARDICAVPPESKNSYRIDDAFALSAMADEACYLTLLDLGTSGSVAVMLLNHHLRAREVANLAGPDDQRCWKIFGPVGVERIKALFTHQPVRCFGVSPAPFRVDIHAVEALRHELELMSASAWTSAQCEFTISEQ